MIEKSIKNNYSQPCRFLPMVLSLKIVGFDIDHLCKAIPQDSILVVCFRKNNFVQFLKKIKNIKINFKILKMILTFLLPQSLLTFFLRDRFPSLNDSAPHLFVSLPFNFYFENKFY